MRHVISERCSPGGEDVLPNEIQDWHNIIYDIRHQAVHCGKIITGQQLLSILLSIYYAAGSMCVACIVVKEGHKEYFIFITILLSSTAWAIVRALVRINRAVEITNEVRDSLRFKYEILEISNFYSTGKTSSKMSEASPTCGNEETM